MNRIKSAARNTSVAFVAYLVQTILAFGIRTAFIFILGREVLGLDNLLLSIVAFLGFAELGINAAMMYSMYKPIANNDHEKIRSLNTLLRRVNYAIAGVVLAIGLCATPLVPVIAGENAVKGIDIFIAYFLILGTAVVSYAFTDKRVMLLAHQKGFIVSSVFTLRYILVAAFQIVVLFLWRDYYLFLGIAFIGTILDNTVIYLIARHMYPFVRGRAAKLDGATKTEVIKNVSAFSGYKISSAIVGSMQSVFLAIYFTLAIVGIYANYYLITLTIAMLVNTVVNALHPTIGNAVATESREQNYATFRKLNLVNWLISGWCSVCLVCLLQPFIHIWAGDSYLFPVAVMIAIVAKFFADGIWRIAGIYQTTTGLVPVMWWRAIIEPVVNVLLAILFIYLWGLIGLFIAMAASVLLTALWMAPYIVYKHYFQKSVWRFLGRAAVFTAITCGLGGLSFFVCGLLPQGFGHLVAKFAICSSVTIVGYLLCYCWTRDFRSICQMFRAKPNKQDIQSTQPLPPTL